MLLLDESPEGSEHTAMSEALEYIRARYSEPIDVSDIADALYMSRAYFTVSFKRTYGSSPWRYLTEYRMRQPQKLVSAKKHAKRVLFSS